MPHTRLSKSVRKFLRQGKARLRCEISDPTEAEWKIQELVSKIRARFAR